MSDSLQARINNARPLSRADNVTTFLIIAAVRQKLEMLSEFLDLADALVNRDVITEEKKAG